LIKSQKKNLQLAVRITQRWYQFGIYLYKKSNIERVVKDDIEKDADGNDHNKIIELY
jgi:hypothetical protein